MKRIWHPYWSWECVEAGMYDTGTGYDARSCREQYAEFLRDDQRFRAALRRVVDEWPVSCEQFLSNRGMNRIAWLGQAAACIEMGIPRTFRGGFKILSNTEQAKANETAAECLSAWESELERSS